ncbi:MAG TPA: MBOAT family O-acyltransferase [Polyangiaceae bacterium]|nr:MBOAT family O-acyltransferase [Polyangiaceae bacterium]
MALNSFTFLFVFLPVVATGYRVLSPLGRLAPRVWLAAASVVFYATSGLRNLCLLSASIAFNALAARYLSATTGPARRRLLLVGVGANLGFLSAFKYANFALGSLGSWVPWLRLPDWAFPLGISFFTLQQIMYLVDCYEELVEPHSLFDHVLFVSFFPSITAGPITRARSMIPQLRASGTPRSAADDLAHGLFLFAIGLFKKAVLADSLGMLVDVGYADTRSIGHQGAWICSIAYALQLYFDFSGYSDMALGAARMLGIDLPKNFDAPYRSRSISEFWQRWHITLSQFITTYLYTPILRAMGRATIHKAALATFIAMVVAGLWHGPSWNYVCFGALHGVALAVNQYWKRWKLLRLPPILGWLLTMLFVNVAFVLFRSATLADAGRLCRMLVPGGSTVPDPFFQQVRAQGLATFAPIWLLALAAATFGRTANESLANFSPTPRRAVQTVALFLVAMLFMNSNLGRGFVYAGF